jgi:putative acetyltransferase
MEMSVRHTHNFLTEEHIQFYNHWYGSIIYPLLNFCYPMPTEDGRLHGIERRTERNVIRTPRRTGKGYGKRLMEYARDKKHMDKVDVNEQNEKALQFYLHLGFQVIGRDETDSMGKPFPILHLQLPEADSANRD